MQSSSSEGIYASLQTLPCCFPPVQSPHELRTENSPNSQPAMNQGQELTHLLEPQPQHLWDFPGEPDVTEGLDSLSDLGIFGNGSDFQDALDRLTASNGGNDDIDDILLQHDTTLNDNANPAAENTETHSAQPAADEHTGALTAGLDDGKRMLKRSFDCIDDATNIGTDDICETSKRLCKVSPNIPGPLQIESPSPTRDTTSCHPSDSSIASSRRGPHLALLPHTGRSYEQEDVPQAITVEHTLPSPSTQYIPDDNSRGERESSVDSLFDDVEVPSDPVPPRVPIHQPLSLPGRPCHTVSSSILSPPESPPAAEPVFLKPWVRKPVSEIIKKYNNIGSQDLLNSMYRQVFTTPNNAEKYISPYPRMGGPLGYLPSTPVAHVKCVEVADSTVNHRVNQYRRVAHRMRYERDKIAWFSAQWGGIDPVTGKSKAQQMREECTLLKRSITFKNKAIEEATAEAELWRNKFRNLEAAHLNLLTQYHAAIAVASKATAASLASHQGASKPTTVPSEPARIDLTAEGPVAAKPDVSALNRMRMKKYNWLDNSRRCQTPQCATPVAENESQSGQDDNDELSQMPVQELGASN
ncbi:conserved hypothetical protein [Trichophyton verrucosum HKI 0517]|uniref:Uncharacterized protein n=1 Tax=Trichophyton verrucosum (strain HKI 0517) TaxID=663202 RepID=D4DBV9_TRIVH|nr:uncharacterized protein TRV_04610 [Trichophyton verrucosum HKI 0517]EFE40679.1 conserved hypothetical protein [Trichophyton verrucosum HKI 0517]